ncbi:ATP-dependent DNA helicase [Pseudomonas chlororaphis]|uniref:ATP-dependent DNA helicase n=1 Tax=Pseudomonas chlororaphis TaxID=587753 RepID=UPI0006A5771A|nr:ATP-dependent DNA helicase [Pseudomonas chlororaphis]AZD02603.1 DinG family ATP-dependent helicase [Pseudomonas chlororaphis subsp. chlororaphis]MBM0280648.1 ATP-dependent DNA helicase [Pseudomonas chlororaphis]MDO1504712.1 ATP-dependent DNA helicase [Pseudomonas chlororaphis]ORM44533.1 ATP-dependent DNA helicase [Pseudomonas chlororaphis subsp. chlororaphis]TWR95843.1 ATP-dependent DNA helicase [Pseudomonas chlororaphis subsp. chlororaphis]
MNYRIAVRALCEFTAKVGDLDLRFTPSPTALEGIQGHRTVAARRSANYRSEVPLEGSFGALTVKGRADGYDPDANLLEEVKTYRGDLERMPANHRQLHWAQAKVYGWLLCQQLQLSSIRLALVYFDILSERETSLVEEHEAQALEQFFNRQCSLFLQWAEQELAHRHARDQAMAALGFPHPDFRPGQRALAESVYKAVSTGRCLMAQAPTGIGKTLGTVFPMLKAMPGQQLDKLFFLTAKTPGRKLALDAAEVLFERSPGLPLRVLELVARDKACEHPEQACHGESCPLAKGFYDRLPAARQAASQRSLLDQQALREIALAHGLCPYYLSQEMARWSDLLVADYNYYFDFSALLFGLAQANQWKVAALVDEAHNLVERGRSMYSASLDQYQLHSVRQAAPEPLKKPLQRLNREWNALHKEQLRPYQAYDQAPAPLLKALSLCISAIGDYLNDHPQGLDSRLQGFYFDALQFARVAELFDEQFLFDISKRQINARRSLSELCLRNVVPAGFLAPRLSAARSTVLFSATLNPWHYYRDLLGLPETTVWVDVESPFSAAQLDVHIVSRISTRFAHRQASLAPIVELIASQFRQRPGNYLAFFSSFDYLQQVASLLAEQHPDIPLWQQSRGMDEGQRQGFLERFDADGQGVGFAVLGGAFGEGIDLPGSRLIGAFIATLGLAQLNPVNEQMKQRMAAIFGAGYDYTYLYPSLQKVVQAAGRVIRSQQDRGVVMLIDDRFAEPRVRQLLPGWWSLDAPGDEVLQGAG